MCKAAKAATVAKATTFKATVIRQSSHSSQLQPRPQSSNQGHTSAVSSHSQGCSLEQTEQVMLQLDFMATEKKVFLYQNTYGTI
ncbi:hypothetical protein ACSBR1_016509 [Camellia fascicularis]